MPMVLIHTPTPPPISSMAQARGSHTATVLGDGRVLIAGGDDGGTAVDAIIASVELYDPSTGGWSSAGSMARQRTRHVALALQDGRILVGGGGGIIHVEEIDEPLILTEVFDPSTDTWSPAGRMAKARDRFAAALLADGRVLAAAGNDGRAIPESILVSAEVYDPASGTWSPTGDMAHARQGHTATTLTDGRVLLAGGEDNSGVLASAEVYDPSTGTWSPTGDMAEARERHTAIALEDGRVLVAGGRGESGPLASAEVYDPATGTWTSTGEMAEARLRHTVTLLQGGSVLAAGGLGQTAFLSSAETYDPSSGTWSSAGDLVERRGFHTAALLPDGRVLVAGGFALVGPLASAELYDPSSGTWSLPGE